MTRRHAALFRMMALLSACLAWGVLEFIALQRARLQLRRASS
ncbi:hypothetical protein [Rhodoferax sp.]|nr:hypothetical protein [Rhodoferax sp.]